MADLTKRYPPYEGSDPYLYFAFSRAEADRAAALLKLLMQRGVRVWYAMGGADSASERQRRLERSIGAELVAIWLDRSALEDADEVKSAALYCQSKGIPVISLDMTETDDLSTGFSSETIHVDGRQCGTAEALESALIHAKGFSQNLMGEQPPAEPYPIWKKVLAVVLALCLFAVGVGYGTGAFSAPDARLISDPVIRGAARSAVGRMVSEADLQSITALHFNRAPRSFEELEKFPNLSRVEIPVEAIKKAAELPADAGYTVVVYGGGK